MILLACGGRLFCELHYPPGKDGKPGMRIAGKSRQTAMDERVALGLALDVLAPTALIQGGAWGADRWCAIWANKRGVDCVEEAAEWTKYGKAAGPIRNAAMIARYAPDYGVAFSGGDGTKNCRLLMERAGIPIMDVKVTTKPTG